MNPKTEVEMEWRPTSSRVICEEEEEEDLDRRSSSRKRKRVRYTEDDEDNEHPGTSTHSQRARENRVWLVTCGNKNGRLHVEKLDRGEACIEREGRWFAPHAFEEFGGKASSKKWKASIFYKNKPLQFWFEQGSLTTKGFKRRGTETIKQKKLLSPNHTSESSSEELEIQSAEETEEDDVEDEDWLPGSEEMTLETEEGDGEKVGAENGGEVVDSGEADKSKGEEDEMGEMEDEDIPTPDSNKDNSDFEERENKLTTTKKSALQKKVKVVVERLPVFQAVSDCQSNSTEHPPGDSWCEPLEEDAQNEEEREHSGSAIYDEQMSDPSITGGTEEENGEEFTQNNETEEDVQREIKTETPLCAPATSTPDVKREILDKTEHTESTCAHTADLSASPVLVVTEASGNFREVTSNSTQIQTGIKEESPEAMIDPPTEPQRVLADCKYENTDASTSGHDAAQSQAIELDTSFPQASDSCQASDVPESPESTCFNPDTMNLDQLKREKIKIQLKVLKLQAEYYALKIKELKK